MKQFSIDFSTTKACIYRGEFEGYGGILRPIKELEHIQLSYFVGIDEIIQAVYENTKQFLHNAYASMSCCGVLEAVAKAQVCARFCVNFCTNKIRFCVS